MTKRFWWCLRIRMLRLSWGQRNRANGMLVAGVAVSDVSQAFGCTRQIILKLITRYVHTGTVRDSPRQGRHRATTLRIDRSIITLTHLRQRFVPATVTARRCGLSAKTVCGKTNSTVRACRPYKGQIMTRRPRLTRVQLARRLFIWRRADWNRVLFRRALCGLLRAGKASILWGWGEIIGGQKTDLVNARQSECSSLDRRRLASHAIPIVYNQGPRVTFQHDNAHTALITRQFLPQN